MHELERVIEAQQNQLDAQRQLLQELQSQMESLAKEAKTTVQAHVEAEEAKTTV